MMLSENQEKAVKNIDGPLLIIAGPGSGKTKTLVERVAYMIENKGIQPEEIMISTFTERAANEIFCRITDRLSKTKLNLNKIYMGTLHSICLRIIDENIEFSYLNKGYKVLDRVEQKFFIYSKLKYFRERAEFSKIFEKTGHLNSWKIGENLIKWFNRISEGEEFEDSELLKKAYEFYKILLFEENSIDFSSIQGECYRILSENEEILFKFQKQVKYIMIDEYQDTNEIQERLIFLLGSRYKNICVVGDDDQGIYRFRGATIKNILRFKEKIGENCKIVKLDLNYRSEKDIVDFYRKWICLLNWENYRYEKNLFSFNKENSLRVIKLSVQNSERDWRERIAKFLIFLKKNSIIKDYNQIAFLFKSVRNKKVIALGEYLESKGIEVYSPRANMFFERDEIIKVIACFLYILLRKESSFYSETASNYEINRYYSNALNRLKKIIENDKKLKDELKEIREEYKKDKKLGSLLELYYKVISTKLFQGYFEKNQNNILKDRALYNLGIFSKLIKKFDRISKISSITSENILKVGEYLFKIHLNYLRKNGVDEHEDIREYAPSGAVSFLTIHQAKGLEFPIVIVGSLEAIPDEIESKKNHFEPTNRIGEFDFWRLFYTAFSRAKNLLILSCVESRGKKREVPSFPFKKLYDQLPDASSQEIGYSNLCIDSLEHIKIKKRYSFTGDILKYQECPFKYNLNREFRFERVITPENFYGKLVHEMLEWINEMCMKNRDIKNIEDVYFKIYTMLSKKDGVFLNKEILDRGLRQIMFYLDSEFLKEKIIDVEKELYALENNYLIEGKIDMIVETNGNLKVIDFKTGDIDEKSIEKYRNQIILYCYLLSMNSDRKVIGGEILFLKTGVRKFISYKKGDEIEILNLFDELDETIRRKKIYQKNISGENCKKCEFKNHCFSINMV